MVVKQPQFTRVEEPTLLCNHVRQPLNRGGPAASKTDLLMVSGLVGLKAASLGSLQFSIAETGLAPRSRWCCTHDSHVHLPSGYKVALAHGCEVLTVDRTQCFD